MFNLWAMWKRSCLKTWFFFSLEKNILDVGEIPVCEILYLWTSSGTISRSICQICLRTRDLRLAGPLFQYWPESLTVLFLLAFSAQFSGSLTNLSKFFLWESKLQEHLKNPKLISHFPEQRQEQSQKPNHAVARWCLLLNGARWFIQGPWAQGPRRRKTTPAETRSPLSRGGGRSSPGQVPEQGQLAAPCELPTSLQPANSGTGLRVGGRGLAHCLWLCPLYNSVMI